MVESKKEVEKELEGEPKQKPFWETVHPLVLVVGGFLLFLGWRSIQASGDNNWLIFVLIAVAVMYLMSKQKKEEKIINPRQSELLVERECERKLRWGQWPANSEYHVGPVSDLKHSDARGVYYNVAVKVIIPFEKTEYYIAKVMASGVEMGFVTLIKSISPLTGRQIQHERDITKMPGWLKMADKHPILEKLWIR